MVNGVKQLVYKSSVYEYEFPLIEIITKEKVNDLAQKLKEDFNRLLSGRYLEVLQLLIKNSPTDPRYFIM